MTEMNKTLLMKSAERIFAFMRNECTLEFLGLCTVLLPPLLASAFFFIGKTVSPVYFYATVAILLCGAFCAGWRRGVCYVALLTFCAVMTVFTFSYVGTDAQAYHFPMQYLLRNGWNPVFDSTIEKFTAIAGDAQVYNYHALFLPKFSSLCGAIVASAFKLFSGDGFLGYVLIICIFSFAVQFAKRFWKAKTFWGVLFAASLTFSTKITSFLAGQVDYSTYASFCIVMLSLVMYIRDNQVRDLLVFAVSSCICMSSKTTGIMVCFVLFAMTLPLLYKRIWYWRTLIGIAVIVAIVGASPLLTAWIQYGSPFYPSMSFNSKVPVVDITSDFTGNADALSMGWLSRVCYAWVSPKVTVAALRLLKGNSAFSPEFMVPGGVAGLGLWFNALLFISAILLALSRKNIITWLCAILFISSNFAPLKYIGYNRYFPQIWAIFPLAALNFICTCKCGESKAWLNWIRMVVVIGLTVVLSTLSGLSFLRSLAYQGRMMVQERFRQNLIATFPHDKPVRVSADDYRFTSVARFKQAGLKLVRSTDGNVDTIMQPDSALPCFDQHPEVYADLNNRFPICEGINTLLFKFQWVAVLENLPHVLRDK